MDFLTYAKSLNPSVLSLPIMGHLNTYDGYGRAVSNVGSPAWVNPTNQGFGIHPRSNGGYSVADGVEQDFTDQTIFVYSPEGFLANPITGIATWQELVTKRSGAGFAYIFRLYTSATTKQIHIYNSAAASKIYSYNVDGKKSLAVKTVGSSSVTFYADGSSINSTTGLDFSSQPDVSIIFGNVHTGISPMLTSLSIGAIFSSALTNEQIELLHYYATKIRYGYQPKIRSYVPRKDNKGAAVDLWGPPNINKIIPAKSNNNNDGTINGSVFTNKDSFGSFFDVHGQSGSNIVVSKDSTINDLTNITFIWDRFFYRGQGGSNFGRLLEKFRTIVYNSSSKILIQEGFAGGNGVHRIDDLGIGDKGQLVITWDRSDGANVPAAYLNGASLGITTTSASSGVKDADNSTDLYLFDSDTIDRVADVETSRFRLYPSVLSADDLRDEYVKYATGHVIRHTSRFEYPVTLSTVSAPNQVGPWLTSGGSHEWIDDGIERYLQSSVTSAISYKQSSQAYGFWYFKFTRTNQDTRPIINFITNQGNLVYTTTGTNGYLIFISASNQLQLYRITNGGVTLILNSSVDWLPDTGTYEIAIARRAIDGQFILYSREANHTTWASSGSIIDNNHTTCNFVQFYTTSTSAIHQFYFPFSYPEGDTLLPNDIKEIAD